MSYIESSLSDGEEVKELFKLHWFAKIPIIILVLVAPVTLGITLIFAVYLWLKLRSLEQGVTNKRAIKKTGIISRKSEEMKLGSIETVEINQGVLGRIFGYGDVKVTGRGISDVVFSQIDDPIDVKKAIEGTQPN